LLLKRGPQHPLPETTFILPSASSCHPCSVIVKPSLLTPSDLDVKRAATAPDATTALRLCMPAVWTLTVYSSLLAGLNVVRRWLSPPVSPRLDVNSLPAAILSAWCPGRDSVTASPPLSKSSPFEWSSGWRMTRPNERRPRLRQASASASELRLL